MFEIKSGSRCGANSMKNSEYCFVHNPTTKKDHLEAASRGGRVVKDLGYDLLPSIKLKRIPDIVLLLEDTINRVRIVKKDGSVDIKVANCIGFLASHLIKAIEISDIATRLEIVERVILERRSINHK